MGAVLNKRCLARAGEGRMGALSAAKVQVQSAVNPTLLWVPSQ